MKSSIFLITRAIPDLLDGAVPEIVAASHPLWKRSMEQWGHWSEEIHLCTLSSEKEQQPLKIYGMPGKRSGLGCVYLCSACSSALDVAWKLVQSDCLAAWDAVIAVRQWSGRGQVRRPWQSLAGNLHVAWRVPVLPAAWDGLTSLVPAWIAARMLGRLGFDVRLKWPNDLIWNGRKIGGILAEQRGNKVIVGLGLNLAAAPGATDLRENAVLSSGSMDGRISPAMCWDQLVSENRSWYECDLPGLQPQDFAQSFSDLLLWKDRRISITDHSHNEDVIHGRVLGVGSDGNLRVSCQEGIRHVSSGEIRPAW